MAISLIFPALLAVAAGAVAGRLHRRLRPSIVTVVLTALATLVAAAVTGAVLVVSVAAIAQAPWLGARIEWCRALASDHAPPVWLGAAGLAALAAMASSTVLSLRRLWPSAREPGPGIMVVASDDATAYAVPGRHPHVVVSTAMLACLDADERRVLFAHERSHLRRAHHRYLRATDLAAALVPPLRPLHARVRYATERWADEDAVAEVGDRRLVARAICRAALAGGSQSGGMAIADLGVTDRVDALLAEAPRRRAGAAAGAITAALVIGVGASTLQLHHLATFAAHVCS